MVLCIPNLFAEKIALSKDKNAKDKHTEVPVDIEVFGNSISICSNEYVDRMTVVAQGDGDSSVLEIDSAVPGEVYEMDLRQSSHGHYDLYIYTSTGEILNGEFEL